MNPWFLHIPCLLITSYQGTVMLETICDWCSSVELLFLSCKKLLLICWLKSQKKFYSLHFIFCSLQFQVLCLWSMHLLKCCSRTVNKGIGVDNMHYLNDGLWKVCSFYPLSLLDAISHLDSSLCSFCLLTENWCDILGFDVFQMVVR